MTPASQTKNICPNCQTGQMTIFYEKSGAAVHSVVLLSTREQALNYTCGDITLGFCEHCGFISNTVYDPTLQDYATDYEATQSYSSTFNAFAKRLAGTLIERYDLHDKNIIEIGCGQGEFLVMLCEDGPNRGVGFDPAYRDEPIESEARDRIEFIADYYSEKYTDIRGDFVCCKMTLEHIETPDRFIETVRRSIGNNLQAVVFFQIPNAEYVLRDLAFWDVYYEHCSYFSKASLSYLFRKNGFNVLDTYTDYDDQYLMIEAKPVSQLADSVQVNAEDFARIQALVEYFKVGVAEKLDDWQQKLAHMRDQNQKVVIWGSGSKGVSFLSTLDIREQIQYCVDINPKKHGMFMARTGQEIVSPDFLKTYQPDVVIVMNPIYMDEIRADLEKMGLQPHMMTV